MDDKPTQDGQESLDKAKAHLKSDGDERTQNNTMRHQYRVLNDEEKTQMLTIKDMGAGFLTYLEHLPASREISLAKTKLEEAVMWAVKSITK